MIDSKLRKLAQKLSDILPSLLDASMQFSQAKTLEQKELAIELLSSYFVILTDLSDTLELPFLMPLAEWADENTLFLNETENAVEIFESISDWVDLLSVVAENPEDEDSLSMLKTILSADFWPVKITDNAINQLQETIKAATLKETKINLNDLAEKLSLIQAEYMEASMSLEGVTDAIEKESILENIGETFVSLADLADEFKQPVFAELAEWADNNFALLTEDNEQQWIDQYTDCLDLLVANAFEPNIQDQQLMLATILSSEDNGFIPVETSTLDATMALFSTSNEAYNLTLDSTDEISENTTIPLEIPSDFLDKMTQIQGYFIDGTIELESAKDETEKEAIFEKIGIAFVELAELAETSKMDVLSDLAIWADENFALLESSPDYDWLNNYVDWLDLLMVNISEPEPDNINMLEAVLTDPEWPSPIPQEILPKIQALFNSNIISVSNHSETISKQISIVKPSEMDIRLWDAFLIETPELSMELADILDQGFNTSETKSAERKAHTIKGSCALVLIQPIASICEVLEDILEHGAADIGIDLPTLSQNLAFNLRQFANDLNAKKEVTHWLNWEQDLAQLQALKEAILVDESEVEEGLSFATNAQNTELEQQQVSIAPPVDMDSRLLDAFFMETPDLVTQLSALLYQGQDLKGDNIQKAQRVTHTIKGSLGMLGLSDLEHFTHQLEDLFELLENKTIPHDLATVFVDSADILEEAMEKMQAGESTIKVDLPRVMKAIEQQTKKLENTEETLVDEDIAEAKGIEAVASIRVPTQSISDLMHIVGELTTAVAQLQGRLEKTLQNVTLLREQGLQSSLHLGRLDTLVDVKGVPAMAVTTDADVDFDPLEMDQYHELHSITSVLRESMSDEQTMANQAQEELRDLVALGRIHERLSHEINNAVLATRMRPVETMLPKLQRITREAARSSGKAVILHIEHHNLLADTDIISGLNDPLLHILRNAVDHSIETPEERHRKGKSKEGHIHLEFKRDGNNISVQVIDDGQGFDVDKIASKAKKKGFDIANLTESDILRLVLNSGFSTKEKVSKLSGRGVGMDVVRESIENLKGTISLANTAQGGAEIKLRLPLTLVSVPVLLVLENNQHFAIPSDDVNQIFYADEGSILPVAEGWIFRFGKQDFSITTLSALLGLKTTERPLHEQTGKPVLLIEHEQGSSAVLVDDAFERRDVVVQPLGEWLDYINGVSGACILADGRVAPILELKALLQHKVVKMVYQSSDISSQPTENMKGEGILVVDDSLSARRSLQIAAEQLGYNVNSAIDGLNAIEKIDESKPALMLVDMEMPNMNGLELTTYIRAQAELKDIFIIMVTSRSQEKHRNQAKKAGVDHYLTKPFAIDELQNLIQTFMAK